MNIIIGVLLVGAGITIDAIYNRRQQKAEAAAYMRGYQHAKAQAEIYKEGVGEGRFQEMLRHPIETPQRKNGLIINETFMEDLHKNGRAVTKIQ